MDLAILMGRRDQIRRSLILTKESPTCWLLWMLAVEHLALTHRRFILQFATSLYNTIVIAPYKMNKYISYSIIKSV